jgi:hypothetical protein
MPRPTEKRIHPAWWAKLDSDISSALSLPVERGLESTWDSPKICYAKIHASEEIPISEIV